MVVVKLFINIGSIITARGTIKNQQKNTFLLNIIFVCLLIRPKLYIRNCFVVIEHLGFFEGIYLKKKKLVSEIWWQKLSCHIVLWKHSIRLQIIKYLTNTSSQKLKIYKIRKTSKLCITNFFDFSLSSNENSVISIKRLKRF